MMFCRFLTFEDYMRKLDVVNRGYGGYSTSEAIHILPEILSAETSDLSKVKLLTIFWGTNDAVDTFQHVQIDQYRENIDKLVKLALSYDIKPIVIGPTLHDPNLYNENYVSGRFLYADTATSTKNKIYSEAAREAATANGVPFVDLWHLFLEYGSWQESEADDLKGKDTAEGKSITDLLADGIHFAPEGYRILYAGVDEAIRKNYPELYWDNLPSHLCAWDKIDKKNIKESVFLGEKV
ncbi:unnamed protein product [Kuraishia capsulata CBS 1993]|uniref:SGNH hydrolase-type esterase domain-containing protein n=1 Tax=Kuraishia capsulata CBS 1993 TaxID=1382522 RepID=W6MXP6_9ASCO|nr:uncharacterized protein KUCA_T00005243001 [Kuraishia capsulata CBS 1993]CDK29255.1 unnamed protein product [Kuraishia capsulata CBS 1993]